MNHEDIYKKLLSIAELLRGVFKRTDYFRIILPLVILKRMACTSSIDCELSELVHQLTTVHSSLKPKLQEIFEELGFFDMLSRLEMEKMTASIFQILNTIDLSREILNDREMAELLDRILQRWLVLSDGGIGEHVTPPDLAVLSATALIGDVDRLRNTINESASIYDPAAGIGNMLLSAGELVRNFSPQNVKLYGQEINGESASLLSLGFLFKQPDEGEVQTGNSLSDDRYPLCKFKYMLSQPPFGANWRGFKEVIESEHRQCKFEGRFGPGLPRVSDSSFLFLMQMLSKLPDVEIGGGRIAIITSSSSLYAGDAGSGESEIRRYIFENDLVEAIVSFPSGIFYNTGIKSNLIVLTNSKPVERQGFFKILDAESYFSASVTVVGMKRLEITRKRIVDLVSDLNSMDGEVSGRAVLDNSSFGYRKIKYFNGPGIRVTDEVPLSITVGKYFETEVLPTYPDAKLDTEFRDTADGEVGMVGYEFNLARHKLIGELKKLETQYKQYRSDKLRHHVLEVVVPASEVNSRVSVNQIAIRKVGSFDVCTGQSASECSGRDYIKFRLKDSLLAQYLELFLLSVMGKKILEASAVGEMKPRLTLDKLMKAEIAIPDAAEQNSIIRTFEKLRQLKYAIDDFDKHLAISPTSSHEILDLIDGMLDKMGGLTTADEVRSLVRQGESESIEFKSTFSLDVRKQIKGKHIEDSSLKTVVAFLNSNGGTLLVGVSDEGEFLDLPEINMFYKGNIDKYLLHWKNSLRNRIGEQFYPYITTKVVAVDGMRVLRVDCARSKKECFLDGQDFYVRTNPATDKLEGPKLLEYVKAHFQSEA